MIEFLSSWAKGLGVTIVVVSIFEMILPNNKSKKYIRMVLGVYVIFNIVAPFIQNKERLNFDDFDFGQYASIETSNVDQTSMDERIQELYVQELEKDITKKIEEKGYQVNKCKVTAKLSEKEEESQISKIKLNIEKSEEKETEEKQEESTENKIVTEIQKIKKVDMNVPIKQEEEQQEEKNSTKKVTKAEIQNIKKFLIEEYGVSEKCLEIN